MCTNSCLDHPGSQLLGPKPNMINKFVTLSPTCGKHRPEPCLNNFGPWNSRLNHLAHASTCCLDPALSGSGPVATVVINYISGKLSDAEL